jgi:hypothetical protein
MKARRIGMALAAATALSALPAAPASAAGLGPSACSTAPFPPGALISSLARDPGQSGSVNPGAAGSGGTPFVPFIFPACNPTAG